MDRTKERAPSGALSFNDCGQLEAVFLENLALGRDAPIGIVIEPGEKAVGIGVGEDLGDADAVAAAEQGHIDACAADDNGIVAAEGGGFAEGVDDHRAGDVKLAVREDDVAAVLQGPAAGKGVERFAPKDDGLADGERLEALEVGGNAEQQRTVAADAPVFGNADDCGHSINSMAFSINFAGANAQTAMGILSSKGLN